MWGGVSGTGGGIPRTFSSLTCETKLGVRLDGRDHAPEHGRWDDVDLVEKDESPFPRRKEVHHLLGLM